jgi:hypothetical protein
MGSFEITLNIFVESNSFKCTPDSIYELTSKELYVGRLLITHFIDQTAGAPTKKSDYIKTKQSLWKLELELAWDFVVQFSLSASNKI